MIQAFVPILDTSVVGSLIYVKFYNNRHLTSILPSYNALKRIIIHIDYQKKMDFFLRNLNFFIIVGQK